jgi:hypothetical protein
MQIRDEKKFVFRVRDGKNSDPGWKKFRSGMAKIRLRDPE